MEEKKANMDFRLQEDFCIYDGKVYSDQDQVPSSEESKHKAGVVLIYNEITFITI